MSAEAHPAVQETASATTTTALDDTASAPVKQPTTESTTLGPGEGQPSDKGTAEAVPNLTNVPKEEKVGQGEVLVESHPINEGVLNLKAPGIKGLIPQKKYFWFSDAPLEEKNLAAYLSNEKTKDVAHENASHATQTGKGLLFYAKRAEDRDHPQGIFNLADMSDIAKGNFNDFNVTIHGSKYTLQAVTKAERDGWLVALQSKLEDAKTSREGIVGSEGYKTQHEKYDKPAAAAGVASKTRSLSRPKKEKDNKSRERKAAPVATKETKAEPVKEATRTTTGDAVADTPVATEPAVTKETGDGQGNEAALAGATAGGVAASSATRKESSEDDKKDKKSRSQSRGNKRSSIFGGLLAKKDENDAKKDAKKADKEVKKEEKHEDKAAKKEDKHVLAAAKTADHKDDKAAKKEEKRAEKAKKEEEAALAATKKEQEKKKLEEEAAIAAADKEKDKAQQEVKDAEKLEQKAEKEADKGDKHDAKAGELLEKAAEKREAAASTSASATPNSTLKEKPNKRASVFGSLFGKKDTVPSPTKETPKDEPVAVSESAPQLDNPVPPTAETPLATTTDKPELKPSTETASATSATTPNDKRRTSFFSNLGTKKERRTDTTSGDELTDGEKKKQSGGFGGLLRKASRAAPKKETRESKTDPAAVAAKEPQTDADGVAMPEQTVTGDKTTSNGAFEVNNGEPVFASDVAPIVAEDAPVAAVPKSEDAPAVPAKA